MKIIESLYQGRKQSSLSDIKILVVDDREDNLLSIESILENEGYLIVKANSGNAALKLLLKDQDFSLILMDVQMPQMNGLETADLIYEWDRLKHIPIIFITAHRFGEDLMFKGFKIGGVDYIHKPIDPALLRLKVGVFVELFRKTRELMISEGQLRTTNFSLEQEVIERKISEERVRQLNQQLIQNNNELKEINDELDRFAFVASHDLQEPLRKILLFNSLVSNGLGKDEPEKLQKHLEKIQRATERLQLLINDLLSYSRHTQTSDHFEEIDLSELLSDVISDLEIEIKKTGAIIETSPLPHLHVVPTQIRQLFQNLISNSIKFARPGVVPQIEIFCNRVEGTSQSGNQVKSSASYNIILSDNGMGFDQQYAEDIFVVFKRLHSYHEIEGTGIGLSICKKIVDKHHGEIKATGIPGKGSTFVISLPDLRPEA